MIQIAEAFFHLCNKTLQFKINLTIARTFIPIMKTLFPNNKIIQIYQRKK